MRLVFDTNGVLSALVLGGGWPGRLRLSWQKQGLHLLANTLTVQELVRGLAYPKFQLSQDELSELLADCLPCTHTVRMPTELFQTYPEAGT